jgi:hypothetical protein
MDCRHCHWQDFYNPLFLLHTISTFDGFLDGHSIVDIAVIFGSLLGQPLAFWLVATSCG